MGRMVMTQGTLDALRAAYRELGEVKAAGIKCGVSYATAHSWTKGDHAGLNADGSPVSGAPVPAPVGVGVVVEEAPVTASRIEEVVRVNPIPAGSADPDAVKRIAEVLGSILGGNKGGLDADAVRKIVREETKPRHFTVKIGDGERKEIPGVAAECLEDVLRCVRLDVPVLLVGPVGCGKTHIGRQVSESLGLSFGFISLTQGISEGKLVGFVDANGKYHEPLFVSTYRNGGVFLFDEFDAADPNVLLIVNAALANGHLVLPTGEIVERHKNFRAIAAANTGGKGATRDHSGRSSLDRATLDRFVRIDVGYSSAVEDAIVEESVLVWGRTFRSTCKAIGLKADVSTRRMEYASRLVASGLSLKAAVAAIMVGEGDDIVKASRQALGEGK